MHEKMFLGISKGALVFYRLLCFYFEDKAEQEV